MRSVYLTLESRSPAGHWKCETIAGFDSVVAAENAIGQIEEYDPDTVHAGYYGIDASEYAMVEYDKARGG